MKKCIAIAFILLMSSISQAQFLKNMMNASTGGAISSDTKGRLTLRGPIAPNDLSYGKAKTYSLTANFADDLAKSVFSRKGVFSKESYLRSMYIFGLKKVEKDEDFKIIYNLTRFEWVNNEDYIETTFQKAPAYYIGMEANLEIQDKTGKIIYKRYHAPKVNMFVTDVGVLYEDLVNRIIISNYNSLFEEFESYYLYGPSLNGLRYFEAKKKKKSKSEMNVEEFNQSVAAFTTLIDVDRENWGSLFDESQKYWKSLMEYKDEKDDDLQKDIRFNASYNLASSYLLLGNLEEAKKYLPAIKENENGFLGVRVEYSAIKEQIEGVERYKSSTDRASSIEAIAAQPELADYKKTGTAFRFAELEGEAKEKNETSFIGKIRLISDFPEVVDYRTQKTGSTFGALLDQMGNDNSSVRVFVEGEKKPKKTSLKKLDFIRDKSGKTYIMGKTGKGFSGVTSKNMVSTKRFALFEEVKASKNLILYHEFFPQDDYTIKRPDKDEFYSPPLYFGRKKSLREFFADCPAMLEKIDKGEYNFENKKTYTNMYDDYMAACGIK